MEPIPHTALLKTKPLDAFHKAHARIEQKSNCWEVATNSLTRHMKKSAARSKAVLSPLGEEYGEHAGIQKQSF